MREFFNGWRRKAGCVLLVMALVFMGGWFRSFVAFDRLIFPSSRHSDWIDSHFGQLEWKKTFGADAKPEYYPYFHQLPLVAGQEFESSPWNWRWRWCGFGIIDPIPHEDEIVFSCTWVIPYWSIVLPLTLLSAYLILWPVKRKAAQPTQNTQ